MQKYQNSVTGRNGDVVIGGSVLIKLAGTATPATLYSDDGITPTDNPLTTDANGYFEFYAADGLYDIAVNGQNAYTAELIVDALTGLAGRPTSSELAAPGAAALIGATVDGNVQDSLDAKVYSAALAADDGPTLIGFKRSAIADTIPVDLYDWLDTMPIRDVEAGCVGNGVSDDTLALNVLTAAGLAAGCKVVGRVGATYKITDTVHINCSADFGGSVFSTTTALATAAIKTGTGALLSLLDIRFPKVTANKADGVVPTAGSIGVQLYGGLRNCRFEFNAVLGFEENLQLYSVDGTTGYISYNSLYFNEIFYGSKINIHLKAESTGWVNQCMWFGGQFAQISADTAAFNTTNVKITKVDNVGNNPPNGHTFFGCSMEGAFTRTILYSLPVGFASTYFSCNTWINCRFEASVSMEFNALALYDLFVGCLSAQSATYVGSVYPNIVGSTRLYRHTTDVTAIPGVAGFRDALNIPLFQAANSGTAAALAVGFNGRVNAAITSGGTVGVFNPGNNTSLYPMVDLAVVGGIPKIEFGIGTSAAANWIGWFNANDLRIQSSLNPTVDITYSLGTAALRYTNVFASNFRPGAGTATWTSGTATPEGAVTATVGSLFTRTDGAEGTTLYVKESGAGNTGWSRVGPSIASISGATTLTTSSAATQLADATAGAFSVNLPTAASMTGRIINVKKIDSSANAVTLDGSGAETIDGATTLALTVQWQSAQIQSNGTAWYVL